MLSIGSMILGLFLLGAFFFVGLVYVQNYIVETPLEKSLTAENKALHHYKIELAAHLDLAKMQMSEFFGALTQLFVRLTRAKRYAHHPCNCSLGDS